MIAGYQVGVEFNLIDRLSPAIASMQLGIAKLLQQTKALQSALNGVAAAQMKVNAAAAGFNAAGAGMAGATRNAKNYANAMNTAAAATNSAVAAGRGLVALPMGGGSGGGRGGYPALINQPSSGGYPAVINNSARAGQYMPYGAAGVAGYIGGNGGNVYDSSGRVVGGGNGGNGGGGGFSNPREPRQAPGLHDAMITAAVGYGVLHALKAPVEEAKKYQIITEKFNQFGMGEKALVEAERFSKTTKVFGTSNTEMLGYMQEAQGIFRESGKHTLTEQLEGAKLAAPTMAKIKVASQGLSPHLKDMSEAKVLDMLRATEMAGGLQSSAKFNEHIGGMFKAIQSSGGNVDFTQYRQFFAKGKSAVMGMDTKALYATMEPIIGELKGGAAGDALMTSFNRLNAVTKVPNQVAHFLVDMGIWDNSKITWNKQGGIHHTDGNPFAKSKEFTQNPIKFYQDSVKPMYEKMGLSKEEIIRQNAMIFGRTGGGLFNLVDKQSGTIKSSEVAYDKARGLDPALEAVSKTLGGGELAYAASMRDFNLALGKSGGLLDLASKGLNKLTGAIEFMTKFANQHPTITKFAMYALAAFGALAVLGGGFLMIGMAFKSVGTVLKFGLTMISKIGIIGPALVWLGKAILTFGRFLVMTPIGMILTAIAVAAYLLYTNWSTILPKLKAIWSIIKSDFMFTVEYIKTAIKSKINDIKSSFGSKFNEIKAQIAGSLSAIKAAFSSKLNGIKTSAISRFNEIKAGAIKILAGVKTTFTGAYAYVKSIMTSIANAIIGGLQAVITKVSGMFSGIGSMVSGMGARIGGMFGLAQAQASKQSFVKSGGGGDKIMVKNVFDAHGITTMVSKGQAKAMSGPRLNTSGHDGSMGLKMVSQGAY